MNENKFHPELPLTKKRFEALLKKAAQPVAEWKRGQEGKGTSESRPSDDCSGKRKCPDSLEEIFQTRIICGELLAKIFNSVSSHVFSPISPYTIIIAQKVQYVKG